MAAKKGAKKVVEKLSLAAVVNCGGVGYIFSFPDEHAELLAAGFVQVNADLKDENGAIATAATQAGIDFVKAQEIGSSTKTEGVEAVTAPVQNTGFVIEDNIAIPEGGRRGGGKPSAYPFDQLQVGQSFFVPATTERPDPAKTLNSTVSSANNRFAVVDPSGAMRPVTRGPNKGTSVPVMQYTRKFVIKAVEGGARIWRTV